MQSKPNTSGVFGTRTDDPITCYVLPIPKRSTEFPTQTVAVRGASLRKLPHHATDFWREDPSSREKGNREVYMLAQDHHAEFNNECKYTHK